MIRGIGLRAQASVAVVGANVKEVLGMGRNHVRYWSFVVSLSVASGAGLAWDPNNGDYSKTSTADLRVMTWNVQDGIRSGNPKTDAANNWNALVRVVAALQPDVLIMQELGDHGCFNCVDTVGEMLTVFDLFLHGGTDPFLGGAVTSYVQKFAPGYDLPSVFVSAETDAFNRQAILSRYPLTDLNGDGVSSYNDIRSVFADAYAPGGDGGIRGFAFAEIDLADDVYGGDLVIGNAHLKCCGGASNEAQRLTAAQNVAYFVDYWYNGAGTGIPDPNNKVADFPPATSILTSLTPVMMGGDWNEDESSNGRRGPARWLTEAEFAGGNDGTDRDRTDMTFDSAVDTCTSNPDTQSSSKLDYLSWQDSVALLRRSFIFRTSGGCPNMLPPEFFSPTAFPINPFNISSIASDHVPVLVDLILPGAGSGSVMISEIMYNPNSSEASPVDVEWVELYNTTSSAVDIGGWFLSDEDGSTGGIPGGTMLGPFEAAVLIPSSQTVADFQAAWGASFAVYPLSGWESGLANLDNSPSPTNEILTLRNTGGITEDAVNFDDASGWPADTPDGASIYVVLGSKSVSGNDIGTNWARSAIGVDGGFANVITADFDGTDVGSPGTVPQCAGAVDCDNNVFCDGAETCVDADCVNLAGDPCPGQLCDEDGDACVDCLTVDQCTDFVFCNGTEQCVAGSCVNGPAPCPGQTCVEFNDTCVDCTGAAECDDGNFCTGVESCTGGSCVTTGDPCAPAPCFEDTDSCGCLNAADCDDGLFCNGAEVCDGAGVCQPGTAPCTDPPSCDEALDVCLAASRMLCVPAGTSPSQTTPGQDYRVVAAAGQTLTIEIFLEDQQTPFNSYSAAVSCSVMGTTPGVPDLDYDFGSTVVDSTRPEYVYNGTSSIRLIDQGQCDPDIPCTSDTECMALGSSLCDVGGTDRCTLDPPDVLVLTLGDSVSFPGESRYMAEFDFVIPENAIGEYRLAPICPPGGGCAETLTSVLSGANELPFTIDGLIVDVQLGQCCVASVCTPDVTLAFCSGQGGIFQVGGTCEGSDPCLGCLTDADCIVDPSGVALPGLSSCDYWYCDLSGGSPGVCASCARDYGQTCPLFGTTVGVGDILCAIGGFSDYFACPNGDVVGGTGPAGPLGPSGPNGLPISVSDILAIVAAFSGANPPACPETEGLPESCDNLTFAPAGACSTSATSATSASSTPSSLSIDAPRSALLVGDDVVNGNFVLVPRQRTARAGGFVDVDVFVSGVEGLVGFEMGVHANGGRRGGLILDSITVDTQRSDYVFNGLYSFPAIDNTLGRLGGALMGSGVDVVAGDRAYVGTFRFAVSADAAGAFNVAASMEFVGLWTDGNRKTAVDPVHDAVVMIAASSRE
jgi:endonuclease/exonuclease/phosphatase family metal-dependent hydrolase